MNTIYLARTLTPALLIASALACRTADSAPHTTQTPAVTEQQTPSPSAVPQAQPVAAAQPVEDEFNKLLAGMGVHYFAAEKKLEVNGWVNMQRGLVEVFACSPKGKTHESVIVLDCVPSGLQAGLLALDLVPGTPVEFGTADQYKAPTGDPVEIELRWRDALGVEHLARAEDWVWDEKRKAPMPRAPWIFAGSFLQPVTGTSDSVTFAADYVKSLATTYHDASSILENPQVDGADDTVYFSNEQAVPAVGTPLTAIFRRAQPATQKPAKQ